MENSNCAVYESSPFLELAILCYWDLLARDIRIDSMPRKPSNIFVMENMFVYKRKRIVSTIASLIKNISCAEYRIAISLQ